MKETSYWANKKVVMTFKQSQVKLMKETQQKKQHKTGSVLIHFCISLFKI